MTLQISIIGLGQIGTSIGLALSEHTDQITRIGHDKDSRTASQAKQMNALDRVDSNLPSAVEKAGLVVLALPADQVRETLAVIAPCLKEGAVVVDTAPITQAVCDWAKELLPERRYYIGMAPVLNPAHLHSHDAGIQAAQVDLFKKGLFAIVTPPHVPSEAIQAATDLGRLLGAESIFFDPTELDSLMTATHILPQLMAAALLDLTIDQPGWREGRKLAGKAYAKVTAPSVELDEPAALASEALLNHEHTERLLNNLIAILISLRDDIRAQDSERLTQRLERLRRGREHWWKERQSGDWAAAENAPPAEVPSAGQMFSQWIGLGGRKPRSKPKDNP
jgi:prephenate dehydrogenase